MTKQLYTSYFNRKGKDPKAVVISCTFPKWLPSSEFRGIVRKDLAPEWWMVDRINNGEITADEYDQLYLCLLKKERKLSPSWIINSLDDGSILICYEKIGKRCHRRTLANWLEEETGVIIPEWLTEEERTEQQTLEKKDTLVDSLLKF